MLLLSELCLYWKVAKERWRGKIFLQVWMLQIFSYYLSSARGSGRHTTDSTFRAASELRSVAFSRRCVSWLSLTPTCFSRAQFPFWIGKRDLQGSHVQCDRKSPTSYAGSFNSVQSACACMLSHFSRVQLFVTAWTVVLQAPLPMGILQARILEWVAMTSSRES